jgi:hypothetical protein
MCLDEGKEEMDEEEEEEDNENREVEDDDANNHTYISRHHSKMCYMLHLSYIRYMFPNMSI